MIFVIMWLLMSVLTFIWAIGKIHGHEIKEFYRLNNPPEYGIIFIAALIWPALIGAVLVVYTGHPWVWPKKGVTYDLD